MAGSFFGFNTSLNVSFDNFSTTVITVNLYFITYIYFERKKLQEQKLFIEATHENLWIKHFLITNSKFQLTFCKARINNC